MARHDIMAALSAIDPASLDYNDWLLVGMALHHEGFPVDAWREWSAGDGARFHPHDFEGKWRGFDSKTTDPVTGGTIVKMAMERGWEPPDAADAAGRPHRALAWDAVIGGRKGAAEGDQEPTIVDPTFIGDDDVEVTPMYSAGHGHDELRAFLNALFEEGEYVGYVCDYTVEERDDGTVKYKPGSRGVYSRTMGDIRGGLKRGIESALSATLHDESGAWIRINPLDGQGVGNANVTDFRHALLESDEMPKGKFAAIVKQLNLPVVAMVDSGNKSLHAIVRVDASDARQYAERVNTLYSRCEKNGIKVDRANKNSSRMTRMPGVTRNGNRQFLAGLRQGAGDWDEWEEWYAAETDELPDAVPLDTMLGENLPALKPALIDGLLRVGHKMLVSGPSKAGKSFALISLCIALAEGWEWFGMECRKSRVMYVNLELDEASCFNRFADVYRKMEASGARRRANASAIDVWNLRGLAEPMGRLLPKMVRRAKKRGAEVVVIDPIYKVMAGDENSAGDMAAFANLFDALSREAGCSVIYCHHHSKGYQGDKRSIDRASGSGVFGRDPDAILDMVELSVDADRRWERVQAGVRAECVRAVDRAGGLQAWEAIPEQRRRNFRDALECACDLLGGADAAELSARCNAMRDACESLTAWRISATLREFPSFKPIDAWFEWPVHTVDATLQDCAEVGNDGARPRAASGASGSGFPKRKDPATRRAKVNEAIAAAVSACADDGVDATRQEVLSRLGKVDGRAVKMPTFKDWTKPSNAWCEWVCDTSESGSGVAGIIVRRGGGNT